jgi:predicted permease
MRQLRAWWFRVVGLFGAGRLTQRFDAELESHIELHVEENISRGMTPEEARRQALIALGGVQAAREAYRDRGGIPVFDMLAQDVRFALRMLRKTPGFTAAAVIVLALGIGANGAVFSLINAVLLRPLNGGTLDAELVGVYSGDRTRPDAYRPFSYPEYLDLRDRNTVFADLIAEAGLRTGITEGEQTRRVEAMLVSSNYFTALQVPMAAGRAFTPDEETPLADAAVAVVSYAFWRRHGLAPDIVGQRILLNARQFTIVGVAPESFHGTMPVMSSDLWLPFGAARLLVPEDQRGYVMPVSLDRSTPALLLAGTLRPGVSTSDAQARLAPLADALAAAYPEFNQSQRIVVQPRSRTARSAAPSSDAGAMTGAGVLMAIAGMVLFVACLNLANLLLARGGARRQEIAVRLALGGSRFRIVRQLVIEGLMLSAFGSAAALAVSWWAASLFVTALRRVAPMTISIDVSPDARVIAVVAAAAIVSTLIFSLGPAWRLSKPELAAAMKPSPPLAAGRARRLPLPSVLVGAQLALSLALLVAAGVFMRAGVRAASSDPGFPLGGGLLAEIDAALIGLDALQARSKYAEVLARVREIPGVGDASLASNVPFSNVDEGRVVRGDGDPGSSVPMFATFNVIGARYFSSIGLPIIAGRDFTEAEGTSTPTAVAIVDRLFVERAFAGTNPVGRVVHLVDPEGGIDDSLQVVGVVPTVRDDILEAPRPHLYAPFGRSYRAGMTLHARVKPGTEARMLDQVRRAIHAVDNRLPIVSLRTLAAHRDASPSLLVIVFAASLFAAFATISLVLATVGVYGLRAYLVTQRTREIGIRMALGATRGGVVGQLLREGARIAAAGLIAGLVLALGLVQILRQSGMLFDVSAVDPIVFTLAPLVLAIAATLASYVPARRALRIDPAVALRPD